MFALIAALENDTPSRITFLSRDALLTVAIVANVALGTGRERGIIVLYDAAVLYTTQTLFYCHIQLFIMGA